MTLVTIELCGMIAGITFLFGVSLAFFIVWVAMKEEKRTPQNKTNYDRIRNKNVEEMVEFMQKCGWDYPPYCEYTKATNGLCDDNCLKCAKQWLESEVDTK